MRNRKVAGRFKYHVTIGDIVGKSFQSFLSPVFLPLIFLCFLLHCLVSGCYVCILCVASILFLQYFFLFKIIYK